MVSEQSTMIRLPVFGNVTFREWHGFVDGFYIGARWGERTHEYKQERKYWRSGYLLGTISRYILVIYFYKLLVDND